MVNYFLFFTIVIIFHIFLINISKKILPIILVFFFIKISLILINNNFFYLMDGNADALNFHKVMLDYSENGFIFYDGLNDVYALSQIGGYIYSLFGEDIMFMQLISLCISSLSLIFFYMCLREIKLNQFEINLSCLIFCFHPFLLNYSILTMREIYAVSILLLSLLFFLKYFNTKNFIFLIIGFFPGILIYFINGGLFVMYFILLLFSLKPYLFNKKKSFLYISVSFFSFFILVTLTLYFLIEILNVPYLRNVKELLFELNPAKIISAQTYIQMKSSSQANYPLFLISNGEIVDFILRSILRYFYFMFSPFPWDISTPKQIIGLLDPFIHIIFFIIIFQNFNKILQDEKLFFLLILYIALTFTYSFGVGNFAQGIRHKTKFIPILMLITSSFYLRAFKDFFVGPRFRNKIMKKIIK